MARILVVDDEAAVRDRLEAKLGGAGHDVTPAQDGAAAKDEAAKGTYDAAVIDCQMPLGGVELYIELKKRYPGLRLIAMTDLGSSDQVNRELVPPADTAWAKDMSEDGIKALVVMIQDLVGE